MHNCSGFPIVLLVNIREKDRVNLLCKVSKNTSEYQREFCYLLVNEVEKKSGDEERNAHCG